MKYLWPLDVQGFACLGGECPASCCRGMEIFIDEDSLRRYQRTGGEMGERLRRGIRWREGTFRQGEGGCAMLTPKGLCFLWEELGEESLCETCRTYPLHVEEFPFAREMTLGLSCPAAARCLLSAPLGIGERVLEKEEEEELSFEEGEEELYTVLSRVRGELVSFAEGEAALEEKLGLVLETGGTLQRAYDEGIPLEEAWEKERNMPQREKKDLEGEESSLSGAFSLFFEGRGVLSGLWREGPLAAWEKEIEGFLALPQKEREAAGRDLRRRASAWEDLSYERALSHVLAYYEAVFLPGACYTGEIEACALLGPFALFWQETLLGARLRAGKEAGEAEFYEAACALSRYLEHDDEVLERVLRFLSPPV